MAFKKIEERNLAGNLSLLAPFDMGEDTDAIDLLNLRVDQAGQLKSRLGHSSLASGLGNINSLCLHSSTRYAGGGTTLRRGTTNIASGFDGTPLGLASHHGYLLCTNRSNASGFTSPIKDNGSAVSRWLPAAPTAAPVVTKATELSTTVSTFDNSETWTGNTGVTLAFDASDKKQGTHALTATFTEAGLYTATRTVSLDLDTVGGQAGVKHDKFRIWIKCDDFRAIDNIQILVDVSAAADFQSDYYIVEIPRKKFHKARAGWVQYEIRRGKSSRAVIDDVSEVMDTLQNVINADLGSREARAFSEASLAAQATVSAETLKFERQGIDDARDWSNATALRIQINARGGTVVHLDGWDVYGSVHGAVEGKEIIYYTTYVTTDGIESDLSPGSDPLKFKNVAGQVALIASAEAQVTGIHVYRSGGTLGTIYRVTVTAEANTNHTYNDITDDDTVGENGIIAETNHQDPPAAAGIVAPYLGRVILYNTTAHPNRFYWSQVNLLHFFAPDDDDEGDWAPVGADGEAIVSATHRNGVLYFYKSNGIFQLVGDPGDVRGEVRQTASKRGAIGPRAVCQGEGRDFFADGEGIYSFDGEVPREISTIIAPIFRGETSTLASGVTIPPIDASNKSKIALETRNNKLYVSYPASGQSSNTVGLVYHIPSGRWGRDSRGFSVFNNEGTALVGGTPAGDILQLETGNADISSAISIAYQSKYFDFGGADAEKTIEDFEISCDRGGATLTVTAYIDYGKDTAATVSLGTISSGSGVQTYAFQFNSGLGQKFFNISIRVTGASTSEIILRKMWFHVYPEARKGKSFDTDEDPLGYAGVKEVRAYQIDTNNPSSSTLTLLSDLPGGAMATRQALTVAATTTRAVIEAMFDARYTGRLFRADINDGSSLIQVYRFGLEWKGIGDYVIAGKLWNSDELNFGTVMVKGARALRIELSNSATVTLLVYSDLPGGTLALRDTITIGASATRRVVTVPLTDDSAVNAEFRGRLFKITATSASDWILFSLAMETRVIGTYVAGGSGEVYDSGEQDWGTERVKLAREIEWDIEALGDVTNVIQSDLPGTALATRISPSPIIKATTTTRRTAKIPLPGHFKGRLHRYKLTSSSDFIVFAGRVFIKAIGSPGATPWQWGSLPVLPTQQGIWQWQMFPVVPTASNEWRWHFFEVDQVA